MYKSKANRISKSHPYSKPLKFLISTTVELIYSQNVVHKHTCSCYVNVTYQRWSQGHKARGQGQGQPFRGQTFSRPRTGMLEAKDQGHKRKCSPKSQKFFRRPPKKKGLYKNFLGDSPPPPKKKRSSQKFY